MTLALNNKVRIRILDLARQTNQYKLFNQYLKNQYIYNKEEIELYQKKKFKEIFKHHFENNESYRTHLRSMGFNGSSSSEIDKIPIISKSFFKNNLNNHFISSLVHTTKYSGGTTGSPLAIHLSQESIDNFWPAIWRAFDVYGVEPCDKIMMIAGPSLLNKRTLKRKIYDLVSNFEVVSAFDLSSDVLYNAYKTLLKRDIKAIYGYTSSVLVFLNFLKDNNYRLDLKCIFTTSETFIPKVRVLAKEYCNCDVIDTYGAKDGGVAAFECNFHHGYHLNFENSLVEIIDNKIICTDLLNRASPFIRYEVGDYTTSDKVITEKCECGRSLFRIESIAGRVNDHVIDIDGNVVHSEFFSHLFVEDALIDQYQILYSNQEIVINMITSAMVSEEQFYKSYGLMLSKRFKMPFRIVVNQEIITLPNAKIPIIVKA
ncbi:hypothetical protein [Pontibacter harenae]|uniref:hypothetical protein n=1 Tax=Pontibacter harenae TaxID=2894083 RepID=UPI001E33027E|nr:hypothetical protein [Pontibacter harenae]MCC9166158.1 hypothetical protein [Pontibacter harenae]